DGDISVSLVHKLRSEMGLTGNLRRRSQAVRAAARDTTSLAPPQSRHPQQGSAKTNGRRRTQEDGVPAALSAERRQMSERDHMLEEIEGDIDRLIFKLMAIGRVEEIEEALRRVRRLVVRRYGA